jgi:transposase
MKSLLDILGGAQLLLGLSFDVQEIFEEYLSAEHRSLLAILRVIEEDQPLYSRLYRGRGRMPYNDVPFFRAAVGKSVFQIPTTEKLIARLENDANLRRICGFVVVPSRSTFSRRFSFFAETAVMDRTLNGMVDHYLGGKLVGHISRDSTAIEAREKPQNRKRDVEERPRGKRRRGRPRKKEPKAVKKAKRLAKQARQKASEALSELNQECCWGCKRNSQGNANFWKGYKLHLDVTDMGIPVTAVVTGANVHDSQVAIPMEKLTERRIEYLYSLMDSAYDAKEIRTYIEAKGRVPLIEANNRGGAGSRGFDPAEKRRFAIRTSVERTNSHLKDWFFGPRIYVRGIRKVRFHLMTGVVCLAAVKILQQFILPEAEALAA